MELLVTLLSEDSADGYSAKFSLPSKWEKKTIGDLVKVFLKRLAKARDQHYELSDCTVTLDGERKQLSATLVDVVRGSTGVAHLVVAHLVDVGSSSHLVVAPRVEKTVLVEETVEGLVLRFETDQLEVEDMAPVLDARFADRVRLGLERAGGLLQSSPLEALALIDDLLNCFSKGNGTWICRQVALTLQSARGMALAELGRGKEAVSAYRRGLRLGCEPELKERWSQVAHNLVLLLLDDRKKARSVAAAAAVNVGGSEPWYELGTLALDQHSLAKRCYRQALLADKKHCGSYVNLASVLERRVEDEAELLSLASAAIANGVLWSTPLQRPPHWYAGLRAAPWWDPAQFYFTRIFKDNHAMIRKEYLAACSEEVGSRSGFAHDGTLKTHGSWKEAVFWANARNDETCRRCPKTAALLDSLSEVTGCALAGAGETLFSTLGPGTRLRPHCGSTNARLTCHFGVIVPEQQVSIRCGHEKRTWQEGESIVFDDSFEHEVQHDGKQDRVVLLLNFWHPDFPAEHRNERWRDHAHTTKKIEHYNNF